VGTNQFYNHNRFYNPELGRYMEPDPIGLDGGLNPYAYAGSNPVINIDPSGLELTPMNFDQMMRYNMSGVDAAQRAQQILRFDTFINSRNLTQGEIDMSRGVFGNRINYDLPRVISVPVTVDNRALAPFGDIIFPRSQYRNDFSLSSVSASLQDTFIHEMTHVMQYQQGIDVFKTGLSLQWDYSVNKINVYDFQYVTNKPFSSYNIEQQGDFAVGVFRGRLPNIIKNRGAGGSW